MSEQRKCPHCKGNRKATIEIMGKKELTGDCKYCEGTGLESLERPYSKIELLHSPIGIEWNVAGNGMPSIGEITKVIGREIPNKSLNKFFIDFDGIFLRAKIC